MHVISIDFKGAEALEELPNYFIQSKQAQALTSTSKVHRGQTSQAAFLSILADSEARGLKIECK